MSIEFNLEMAGTADDPLDVARGVRRILAGNASQMTFMGTNTYIVGGKELVVIDPGPNDEAHCRAILAAAGGSPITDILITHRHLDHTDGTERLRRLTGARVAAFALARSRPRADYQSPSGKEFIDFDLSVDRELGDGDRVEGGDFRLAAVHTPGHAPDHLCVELTGEVWRDGPLLFTGDHIMGWNTTVIAPPEGQMGRYFASLERLITRNDRLYLPGHGEVIHDPQRMAKAYAVHRRMREAAIIDNLRSGIRTIAPIVAALYRTENPQILAAASLSVLAHLEHLTERGLVSCDGSPGLESHFSLPR